MKKEGKEVSFDKEVLAYSLHNAIEFGGTKADVILPKLFQHGLEKSRIKEIMPLIQETVQKVNAMKLEERVKKFKKFRDLIKVRKEEKRDLPELPGSGLPGKKVFRAAPFPSGALHIGNAKTFILNALYAERYHGNLILVIDDTIGSAEKQPIKESYALIEEAFKWLNIRYKKPIIYKSDRLKIYYDYAKKLIDKNKAYVCHCSQQELRENRFKGVECACRQYPPGIQLARWKEMFRMREGEAILRIRTGMMHPNPAFRDRVLFKISDREHPRVGKKYRVWPTLEMTWAIDDHLLGITHIIRGSDLMIETDMEKYIWDIFRWKHPVIIHTGKINIGGVKISKSKFQKEVKSGAFKGWSDPRTWSIQSLARRGIEPLALRDFVFEIGLNKQDITVPIEILYAANRRIIDETAKRYFFVHNPIEIEVVNAVGVKDIDIPIHPDTPEKTRNIKIGKTIHISEEDFDKFVGDEVRLLHLFNIELGRKTTISSIENKKIPKIQWVSNGVKTRILMLNGDWIEGFAEPGVSELEQGDVIQFERFGFCKFDGLNSNGMYEFWYGHR